MNEIKSTKDNIGSILNQAKETICKLNGKSFEITQLRGTKRQNWKREGKAHGMWGTSKHPTKWKGNL